MDKVAVLLPIYAGDKLDYIIQSVQSIKKQTYSNLELIVLIDGPIEFMVYNYINDQKEITILKFDKNRGLPFVLNDGIKYCTLQNINFIARMDADDISSKSRIEKQVKFLLKNPKVDVLGGAILEIDEKGKSRNKKIIYPLNHDNCRIFFKKRDPLAHPTVLFRSSFFKKAGLYSEKHRKNQDTFLWYNGFLSGAVFANIPDIVLYFRITDDFFQNRRNGIKRALWMLKDRLIINWKLKFDITAYAYALGYFAVTIAPYRIKKIAYKLLR